MKEMKRRSQLTDLRMRREILDRVIADLRSLLALRRGRMKVSGGSNGRASRGM